MWSRQLSSEFSSTPLAAAVSFEAELAPLLQIGLRLATVMLVDRSAAEDAVQEAALQAWRHRDQRRETALRPWFLAIVANQCRETRRGRWLRLIRLDPEVPGQASPTDDVSEDILDLRAALVRLSPRDRLAIALRYYLDLSFEDVALTARCSVSAAKSRVRRGERVLRAALAHRGSET